MISLFKSYVAIFISQPFELGRVCKPNQYTIGKLYRFDVTFELEPVGVLLNPQVMHIVT